MNFFSRLMTFHYFKITSCKKSALKYLPKSTGKPLCQSLFLMKLRHTKRLWHRCFPVNIAKFLRTPFFIEHFRWLPVVKLEPSL